MARTISLNSLTLTSGNYSITEVGFDSAPTVSLNMLEIGSRDGAKLISARYNPKEISISGMIKGTTQDDLDTNLDTFKKIISGTNLILNINVIGVARTWTVQTQAVTIGDPRLTYNITFIPYELTLVACDPPFAQNDTYSSIFSANDQAVNVYTAYFNFGGTAPPTPEFNFKIDTAGSLSTIGISNETTGKTIDVGTAWANLDTLEIDCDEQTVMRNNQQVDFEGVFPEFDITQANKLKFTYDTSANPSPSQETYNSEYEYHGFSYAQQFVAPATTTFTKVSALISIITGYIGLVAEIRSDSGSDTPTTTVLGTTTSTNFGVSDLTWVDFTFNTPVSLTSGTKYWFRLQASRGTLPVTWGDVVWKKSNSNPYTSGIAARQTGSTPETWSQLTLEDFAFKVYRTVAVDWTTDLLIQHRRRYL